MCAAREAPFLQMCSAIGSVQIRAVEPGDIGFLADMLCEAVAWRTGEAEAVRKHLGEPHPARYLDGWGRSGDRGVVVVDESGRRVGAAWCRLFTQDDRGYGFVDEHTPEITLAVEPSARGRGLGEALMHALVAAARLEGHRALSLSVEEDNGRAARIYTKLGFRRVGREDNAWTMLYRVLRG
jgi:ribosomal protein S18 acetylase RimI-like enzyme